jgi:hypothetical protein
VSLHDPADQFPAWLLTRLGDGTNAQKAMDRDHTPAIPFVTDTTPSTADTTRAFRGVDRARARSDRLGGALAAAMEDAARERGWIPPADDDPDPRDVFAALFEPTEGNAS